MQERPTSLSVGPWTAHQGRQTGNKHQVHWVALSILLAELICLSVLLGGGSSFALSDRFPVIIYRPEVAAIVSQVTTQALKYDLDGLTGERPVVVGGAPYTIATRKSYDPTVLAMTTAYAYEQFASTGLTVTYHEYTWTTTQAAAIGVHVPGEAGERPGRNVVAEKPGRVDPRRIYLLTAHMDTRLTGVRAPGADDNGSGSVAVLTAARLLAPHDFAYTIRFVLFTCEELGLEGSSAYAATCASQHDDIRGMVNLDMLAYNSDAERIIGLYGLRYEPASLDLTQGFARLVDVYGLRLAPRRFDAPESLIGLSDQWSFLLRGYPAMLAIEDWDDHTPQYHLVGDRVSTLDLDYYADYTRAAIATIAHLAILVR